MLIFALVEIKTAFALIVPMWIFIFGFAFVNPNTTACALHPFPDKAGTASSATNFIRGLIGVAVSFVISFFSHEDALVFALTLLLLSCAATLSIRLNR